LAAWLLNLSPEDDMRANQAGWTMAAAVLVAAAVANVPLRAADDAAAAVTPTAAAVRRVVVSLPDRKLVVIANDRVLARFDVAVGAPSTPSPIGTFTIVNRLSHRPPRARSFPPAPATPSAPGGSA
jgi:hypothetical protein